MVRWLSLCIGFIKGYTVESIPVDREGVYRADWLRTTLQKSGPRVALVSLASVNNETGAMQDVLGFAAILAELTPLAVFHSDCCQVRRPPNSPISRCFSCLCRPVPRGRFTLNRDITRGT